ncbi:hypothetical protein AC579_8461 [Pseudocercospora musae]|uniref:Uncharacterized protein n=1 Tax=Pseudocercospora musae TaxID=113226 RepID=A0A139I2F8_9PEZI|nr:hypothetical protein AC579_8461 [Pseudocercospora musae]
MHDRDLLMLMNLNGRERTLSALEELCSAVKPKLRVRQVHRPEQGELSLIDMTLDGIQSNTANQTGVANRVTTNDVDGHASNGVNGHA